MNVKCDGCKAKGVIQCEGRHVGNHQPYDRVCPGCNGVGHFRVPGCSPQDAADAAEEWAA